MSLNQIAQDMLNPSMRKHSLLIQSFLHDTFGVQSIFCTKKLFRCLRSPTHITKIDFMSHFHESRSMWALWWILRLNSYPKTYIFHYIYKAGFFLIVLQLIISCWSQSFHHSFQPKPLHFITNSTDCDFRRSIINFLALSG